ncbi:MAG: glycosyltransferase, partial [Candidatus Eisenbacteria bacterium]
MARDASEPAISVVMAVLDGARFIGEQLASIAAQTVLPGELVVGDEGSVDSTVEIVERFAAGAPFPVVLIRNPVRLGVTENFLALSMRARGPIIALSDCDDVWDPHKLERIAPWFADPAVGLVKHRALVVDESLRPLGRRYPAIGRTLVRPAHRVDPWLPGSGMGVFRRSLLEVAAAQSGARPREAGGHSMDHDDWIYFLAGSLGKTVFLAEDLALYRQHGGSYMGA